MKKIKVLVVEPGKEPYMKRIKNSIKSFQNEIGGGIELIAIENEVYLILNKKSNSQELTSNRYIGNSMICGTFLVIGRMNRKTIQLPSEKIQKYTEYFKLNNHEKIVEQFENRNNIRSKLVNCNM